MKINIKVETKNKKYSVGDIIVTNSNETHFIYKDPSTSKYSLLNCSMDTWASGSFETIDKLLEDLRSWTNFKHYPKREYQLELVPMN
ncbi:MULTISPECIES: hypothetical protein [Bacillus cereus group]|uniref:hypothetical protein n=1 Tax=Bacillus cereus group TaxID=86661 RepID=UPI001D0E8CDE|nr:hypothetical protein [Bacillus cereus]MCC2361699.1 hypothetical protein [Bacillus cereus]MDA2118792.1 hypothetical protein [Bacillus cereus]MDA2135950.1 hypothetical protein [Bacillus cereus]